MHRRTYGSVLLAGALLMTSSLVPGAAAASRSTSAHDPTRGVEWTQLDPRDDPSYTFFTVVAAYDPAGHEIVLYERTRSEGSDTWVWTGNRWRGVPGSPSARAYASMATDEANNQVVLFGGSLSEGQRLDETWVYADRTWRLLDPEVSPRARTGAAMAYDPISGRVLLFGGDRFDDTWAFDGTDWQQLFPAQSPGARVGAKMAYDPRRGELILYGGATSDRAAEDGCEQGWVCNPMRTWAWDGATWHPLKLRRSPADRVKPVLVQVGDRLVMYGGESVDGTMRGDTWVLKRHAWRRVHQRHTPSPRVRAAAAWDPGRHQAIMFGGMAKFGDRLAPLPETWSIAPVGSR